MLFDNHLLTETKTAFTNALEAMQTFQSFFTTVSTASNTDNDATLPFKRKIETLLTEISQLKKTNEQLHSELFALKTASSAATTMHNDVQQIKAQVDDIHQTFFGKVKNITHIQTKIHDNIMTRSGVPPQFKVKSFNSEIRIENIHSRNYEFNPIILSDNRLVAASGNEGTDISICAINYENKTWEHSIKKENAHTGHIRSFLELPNNILLSCGEDCLIKYWRISDTDITEFKSVRAHDNEITKLLTIESAPTPQYASSSIDKTIILWNGVSPFHSAAVLRCEAAVNNMMYVRSTNSLIASCVQHGLEFWDLRALKRTQSIKGVFTAHSINAMIELPYKRVALSSDNADKPIVIVDAVKCVVLKEITLKGVITHCSSLCMVDDASFMYMYEGKVVQVALRDYSVISKSTADKTLNGLHGLITIDNGKYILISNSTNGISVCTFIFT